MIRPQSGALFALALVAAIPASAVDADAPMVGDWDCGGELLVCTPRD